MSSVVLPVVERVNDEGVVVAVDDTIILTEEQKIV